LKLSPSTRDKAPVARRTRRHARALTPAITTISARREPPRPHFAPTVSADPADPERPFQTPWTYHITVIAIRGTNVAKGPSRPGGRAPIRPA